MYARLDLIKGSLCIAKSSGVVLSLRMKNYLKKIYLFNIFMHIFFSWGFWFFSWFCLGFFSKKTPSLWDQALLV